MPRLITCIVIGIDLDEYETKYKDEGEQDDGEEEYEDEEVHQPTEQEMECLKLRQKLDLSLGHHSFP